jgi:hypothetical protein
MCLNGMDRKERKLENDKPADDNVPLPMFAFVFAPVFLPVPNEFGNFWKLENTSVMS